MDNKKTIAALTALAMTCAIPLSTYSPELVTAFAEDQTASSFILGDANSDNEINVTDIAVTAAHIKGIKALTEKQQKAADVNKDSSINVTDIAMIAAHIKGISAIRDNGTDDRITTSDEVTTADDNTGSNDSGDDILYNNGDMSKDSGDDIMSDHSSLPDPSAAEETDTDTSSPDSSESATDNKYESVSSNAAASSKAGTSSKAATSSKASDSSSTSERRPLSGNADVKESVTGYYTPQDFGAKGDGKTDDTAAFRKMFKAAYDAGYPQNPNSANPGWRQTKAIFIPSGVYNITGPVVDDTMGMRYARFEVSGAGRESTRINFTGSILFDTRISDQSDNRVLMGFTTFRDIEFMGNNNNTVINMCDSNNHNSDGVQRLQFISCSFTHVKKIIECLESYHQLSEVTFAYCKIVNCGTKDNPCRLFTMNCSQAVNWRFDFTDIEGFNGDAFYYKRGSSIYMQGGSIIPITGNVFFFDFNESARTNTAGESNSPHLCCDGTHFEIKYSTSEGYDSTLLKTTSVSSGTPNVVFRSCKVGTSSNNSPHCLDIQGGGDILFDNCYDCGQIRITGDVTANRKLQPRVKFVNCSNVNVNYLTSRSTIKSATGGLSKNNVHITVDDTYDFYLANGSYVHTTADLHECRQPVNLSDYSYMTVKSAGKTVTTKPYGYVKYVELTVPNNSTYGDNYPVDVTVYNGSAKVGETTQITFGAKNENTYLIPVYDYVDDLNIKLKPVESQDMNFTMNMEIVKF